MLSCEIVKSSCGNLSTSKSLEPEEWSVRVHERQCSVGQVSLTWKKTVQGNIIEFCKTVTGMRGNPFPVQELGAFLLW